MVDDIDHLGNRRVRAVGELMENQFRIGLVRMERAIKEKMRSIRSFRRPCRTTDTQARHGRIREFFGSSQLCSSWIRQPLSRSRKRRLRHLDQRLVVSAGLSARRAPTHYGRICPSKS